MSTTPGRLERWAVRRGTTAGALTIGGPGVRVERGGGRIVIAQSRSATHVVVAVALVLLPALAATLLWPIVGASGRVGLAALALAGAALAAMLLAARHRYEVDDRRVREDSSSLAGTRVVEWPLASARAVRIVSFPHEQTWTMRQVQVAVEGGWVPLAESLNADEARAFARDLADVTGATLDVAA